MVVLNVKLLSEEAYVPSKNNHTDEGWDLYSPKTIAIPAGGHKTIPLDIAIAFPEGYWGQIEGRSGLAHKNGVFPVGGVIDTDYTGTLGVILVNHSNTNYIIREGDRIAQLVIRECIESKMMVVSELDDGVRGADGFGSSGK